MRDGMITEEQCGENFAYILEQLKRTKANENAENSKDGWNFHHDCDIIFINRPRGWGFDFPVVIFAVWQRDFFLLF